MIVITKTFYLGRYMFISGEVNLFPVCVKKHDNEEGVLITDTDVGPQEIVFQ